MTFSEKVRFDHMWRRTTMQILFTGYSSRMHIIIFNSYVLSMHMLSTHASLIHLAINSCVLNLDLKAYKADKSDFSHLNYQLIIFSLNQE